MSRYLNGAGVAFFFLVRERVFFFRVVPVTVAAVASSAMVVVASLIGAKGLGEDVLEALQYANVGQGILAGFSILFCAMILDRIVQGQRK